MWGAYTTQIEYDILLDALARAGAPSNALEVGCEGGRWSKILVKAGWQMMCTDVDEPTLRICQSRIPNAHCVLVNPSDVVLPCNSNTIRLLLCIEVPQLFHQDWFLFEANRVLEVGGLLVTTCSNLFSWRGLYSFVRGTSAELYPTSYLSWKRKLRKYGFTLLRKEGYAWLPFSRSSNSQMIPSLVHLERIFGLRHLTALSPWIGIIARKESSVGP
jgi:ubiquinone/menaquinone biosynthesis C-methylase UbiE